MRSIVCAEEFGQLNKEAEKQSTKVPTNQNPSKSSNAETSTNSDYVNFNSLLIIFPNTSIQNQPFSTITKPINVLDTTMHQKPQMNQTLMNLKPQMTQSNNNLHLHLYLNLNLNLYLHLHMDTHYLIIQIILNQIDTHVFDPLFDDFFSLDDSYVDRELFSNKEMRTPINNSEHTSPTLSFDELLIDIKFKIVESLSFIRKVVTNCVNPIKSNCIMGSMHVLVKLLLQIPQENFL